MLLEHVKLYNTAVEYCDHAPVYGDGGSVVLVSRLDTILGVYHIGRVYFYRHVACVVGC